jgi:hypothetical protein
MKCLLVLVAVVSLPLYASAQVPRIKRPLVETYESTAIDGDGNLQIVTADHKTITVRKGGYARAGETFGTQTAFQAPVISRDGRAVGAQAMFGNCCTSYDVPLQLAIRAAGKIHRFEGGLAIFDWHFVDGGKRVAYSQQIVHFACSVHWELRDIATERLLASSNIPAPCGQIPEPPKVNIPKWVSGPASGIK